ncbi:MAG: MerC domain-containing protein [Planctomycetota bacterium]
MSTTDLTNLDSRAAVAGNSSWRDWLGVTASIGCAIHCAAMPFVIAYLPALGLSFLAVEAFHKWMALFCFLIAIAAFIPGLRTHQNWLPVSIGAFGLGLITFAAFGLAGECCPSCSAAMDPGSSATSAAHADEGCEHCDQCAACEESQEHLTTVSDLRTTSTSWLAMLGPWITPLGGLVLVTAHLLNRRLACLCGCCQPSS